MNDIITLAIVVSIVLNFLFLRALQVTMRHFLIELQAMHDTVETVMLESMLAKDSQ